MNAFKLSEYEAQIKILNARIEAYAACMRLCAQDLMLVAEGLKVPEPRLLQVLNRLQDWSQKQQEKAND